jgi:hypothetical protein
VLRLRDDYCLANGTGLADGGDVDAIPMSIIRSDRES